MRLPWEVVLYVAAFVAAIVIGETFSEPVGNILAFAAACWLGGWSAADLYRDWRSHRG